MIRKKLTSCIGVFLLLWLASCSHNDKGAGTDAATYIPDAPDYADATMWYTRENSTVDKGADVFYLVSTWETDWTTADGRVCHYADVHNATHLPCLHLGDRLDHRRRARLPLCRRA